VWPDQFLTSSCTDGRSTVTGEFLTSVELENAANDVRDKVSQAVRRFRGCRPSVVFKADADAQTILTITVQSDQRSCWSCRK
jgi:multidrug efflux pump